MEKILIVHGIIKEMEVLHKSDKVVSDFTPITNCFLMRKMHYGVNLLLKEESATYFTFSVYSSSFQLDDSTETKILIDGSNKWVFIESAENCIPCLEAVYADINLDLIESTDIESTYFQMCTLHDTSIVDALVLEFLLRDWMKNCPLGRFYVGYVNKMSDLTVQELKELLDALRKLNAES